MTSFLQLSSKTDCISTPTAPVEEEATADENSEEYTEETTQEEDGVEATDLESEEETDAEDAEVVTLVEEEKESSTIAKVSEDETSTSLNDKFEERKIVFADHVAWIVSVACDGATPGDGEELK